MQKTAHKAAQLAREKKQEAQTSFRLGDLDDVQKVSADDDLDDEDDFNTMQEMWGALGVELPSPGEELQEGQVSLNDIKVEVGARDAAWPDEVLTALQGVIYVMDDADVNWLNFDHAVLLCIAWAWRKLQVPPVHICFNPQREGPTKTWQAARSDIRKYMRNSNFLKLQELAALDDDLASAVLEESDDETLNAEHSFAWCESPPLGSP